MQLHPRLVEDAGRRPALRAAHDGLRAVLAAHPRDLARDQIERLVPRHRHERLAAAALAVAGAVLEPALAHHRLSDARFANAPPSGIALIRCDGSGSCSNGRTPTIRPSSTSARNAPQCE